MGVGERLARNVVETRFESLSKETVERAKWRILDSVGCALVGVRAVGCQMLLDLVKGWGGSAESTILGYGGKAPAHNAAMLNGLLTRSFDFEPVEAEGEHKTSPAHISGTTVATALAMAERERASGKELITALLTGDDLAARLGVASGFDFSLGWDNTGTINLFGATAIAARLLKLNERQVFNAFGLALEQAAGSMAPVFDKTIPFKLPIALSSRDGIFAAELARKGYGGVDDPFLGPRGFFALYCRNYDTQDLLKDLGKRYYGDCVIKPYSACRATHPFIDCALDISRSHEIKLADVEKIAIHATPGIAAGFCGQPFSLGETPQVNGAFSIRYTVATALLRKAVKPEYFEDKFMRDPAVKALIDKMDLIGDIPQEKAPAAQVTVQIKSGQEIVGRTDFPKGDFRITPLSGEEIEAKYRSNLAYSSIISARNAERALNLIENLEQVEDIVKLIDLLVPA